MTILVTGATGTVGRRIVDQLVQRGRRVRALTRDPARAKAAGHLPAGVEIAGGELTEPESLGRALDGVTAMHMITFDGAANADLVTGPEVVRLAAKAGVHRLTILSNPVEDHADVTGAAADHSLEWTRLVPLEFMTNTFEWAESIRADGVVRAFGDPLNASVDPTDISAVAATALLEPGHAGETFTISGPEPLTWSQKVAVIGAAIGRDLEYVQLTEEQARADWAAKGFHEEIIEIFVDYYGNPPEIGYTVVPTVERVTGRPPRTFAQWVTENAGAFRA